MIEDFADSDTEDLFFTGKAKRFSGDVRGRMIRKLQALDVAKELSDLKNPPGNRLEALSGDRLGYYSIRINDQWRLCFRWHNGNAYDVEIVDYH